MTSFFYFSYLEMSIFLPVFFRQTNIAPYLKVSQKREGKITWIKSLNSLKVVDSYFWMFRDWSSLFKKMSYIKYKYFSYVQRIFEWFNEFNRVLTRWTEFSLAFVRVWAYMAKLPSFSQRWCNFVGTLIFLFFNRASIEAILLQYKFDYTVLVFKHLIYSSI